MALLTTFGTTAAPLGAGGTSPLTTPTQVGSGTDWDAISIDADGYHTLGLRGGQLWAWGLGNVGRLGVGDTTDRNVPTQVGTDTNWSQVAAGFSHGLAVKTDGTLWSWGSNANGECGQGDTTQRNSPTQVGSATNWVKVAASYHNSYAIKTDGTLWSCGKNNSGQLGQGDTTQRTTFTQVGSATDWAFIAAGEGSSSSFLLAIKTSGTLWACGVNASSQLGLGDTTQRTSLTQVGTDTDWALVAAGDTHSAGIKTTGTLWTWGAGQYGKLGQGSTADHSTPTQVGSATNWAAVQCSEWHTYAKNTASVAYGAGRNNQYQLGIGSTAQQTSLTLIAYSVVAIDGGEPFGAALVTSLGIPEVNSIPLALTLTVESVVQNAYLPLTLNVYGVSTVALPLELVVGASVNQAALPLTLEVSGSGIATLPLMLVVFPVPAYPFGLDGPAYGQPMGRATKWRPVATLGGADISANLDGVLDVDAEENAARIANLSFSPAPGVISPLGYVGATVTIDFATQDENGNALYPIRQFTGIVDVPSYDPVTKLITLHCTDDRQGILAATDTASLDSLIGGHNSQAVLGIPTSNLEYAENQLSTIPSSLDLSAKRIPRVTPWAAKATADFILGVDDPVDDFLRIRFANRTQLRNRVDIKAEYRFARLKSRVVSFRWAFSNTAGPTFGNWGIWAIWPYSPEDVPRPTRGVVQDAAQKSGWEIISANYVDRISYRGVPMAPWEQVDLSGWPLDGVSARLRKRYGQTVTEEYALTVRASSSIRSLGEVVETRSVSMQSDFDINAWEADPLAAPVLVDPPKWGEVASDQTSGTENGRTDADAMIAVTVAQAQVLILAGHRLNGVEFNLPLSPILDLTHTVELEALGIHAKGKVRRVQHHMDIRTGENTTGVDLAISGSYASGIAQPATSSIVAPTPPSAPVPTDEVVAGWNDNYGVYVPSESHVFPFNDMADNDPTWLGWVVTSQEFSSTTEAPTKPATEIGGFVIPASPTSSLRLAYDSEFRVGVPGVETEQRDPITLSKTSVYDVDIPDDLLEQTV